MSTTMTEQQVADKLGVSPKDVAEIRKEQLYEREDWIRHGRVIEYLGDGIRKLQEFFGLKTAQAAAGGITAHGAEKTAQAATASAGGVFQAKVLRTCRNPRLVFAEKDGAEIRVMVRESKNFLPGMMIPVRHGRENVYYLAGRCPRWKGRM